ncbi:MAG TPA: DUF3160 domain-containing protein [bacterium]|nr:DUF3160 domain-containing protein [bacterium]
MTRTLILLALTTGVVVAGSFPLDSAANISQFKLTTTERGMLSRNGFVVVPDSQEQLFQLYVSNWWDSIPSFVTSDLMLQAFHLCVNSTLRRIEEDKLYFRLVEFSVKMSDKFGEQRSIPALGAYFGVACHLLGVDIPQSPEVESLCQNELALIEGHAGRHQSAIFPFELDYSQFVPRGHYTRSDRLQRYFKAMMWYGQVPFPLDDPGIPFETRAKTTYYALSIATAMHESDSLVTLWREIAEITGYFSGASEAYTPVEYMTALNKVYSDNGDRRMRWTNPGQVFMDSFSAVVKRIREPKIHAIFVGVPTGSQFRVFGQRYVPDTDIMQRLVEWPDRPFPKGLDVFAALGSGRAEHILTDVYREQDRWPDYPESLAQVRAEFARKDTEFWYQNVYYAWLYALQALNEPVPSSAPRLMQHEAWQDKSLNTSCGSWAELRHDAILYAQGTLAEASVPAMTTGYVEPNPELYRRLLRAVATMENLLANRGLETSRIREDLLWFKQTLGEMQAISQKELVGTDLTEDERSFIWNIGNDVERISCRLVDEGIVRWFAQAQGTDRFMACIADIATAQNRCLEVGVAAGNAMYALVPIEGKWMLARGAVFSYREFEWPASDRLTDEKWQQMVRDGKAPAAPVWTKSFTAGE